MSEPIVTVAVVPRERLSATPRTLDDVYAKTDAPFRLICLDGRAPRATARAVRRRAQAYGFELVRVNRYLTPNEARNLVLQRVRTKYVAFLDNDARVTPSWLRALLECAEDTGAAVCGPVQLIGELQASTIHLAGGIAHITEEGNRRRFRDGQLYAGQRLADVGASLRRQPVEMIEFHCMLVRMDAFERLGPLDERLLNIQEYADLCLAVRAAGLEVYFEPRSIVTYIPPPPLAVRDIPYFMLRWSEDWTRRTLDHFAAKWQLDPSDTGLESSMTFARWHRRLPLRQVRARIHRTLGCRLGPSPRPLATLERAASALAARSISALRRGTRQ